MQYGAMAVKQGLCAHLGTGMRCHSLAIDLGGTIEDTWQSKRIWFASRGFDLGPWPQSRLEVIRTLRWQTFLYEQMAEEVYSDRNILNRQPVEGVASALKTLASRFRIIIVSSRSEWQRITTIQWLQRYRFLGLIDNLFLLGENSNKLDWCLGAHVSAFIDDDVRHLECVNESHPILRVHYCPRPPETLRPTRGILRARSWQDVVDIVMAPSAVHTVETGSS